MHRDDADALNRALDAIAMGEPSTGADIDPDLLATVHWFDDLGQKTAPDAVFVRQLEQELLRQAAIEAPALASPGPHASVWRRLMRPWSELATPAPRHPRRTSAARALVWGSWAVVIVLVAGAIFGALQFLPGGSDDDLPAVAPGFPLEVNVPVDLASHPIVGAWRLDPDPGRPTRVVFHADGTYLEVDPLQGTGVGVWRPTGERSAEVVVEWPNRNPPGRLATDAAETDGIGNPAGRPLEYLPGRSTMRSAFTVSQDGASLAGTFHLQQFLPDGDLMPEEAEGNLTGTRLGFDAPAGAESVDPATHPAVGAWIVVAVNGPPSVVTFHADGTYVEESPLQGTGVGVWRPADARSGEVIVEWPNRSESGRREAALLIEGYIEGWTTVRSTFTMGDDGMSLAGTYESKKFYPGGVEFHADKSGEITGTRIVSDAWDTAENDSATHPIVGAWITTATPSGHAGVIAFHADGTVTSVNTSAGTGVGVWRATGERSSELIVQWANRNTIPGEYQEGQTILNGAFTVAEAGASFTGTHDIELFTPGGSQPVENYEGEVDATRITLDHVEAATPEA